MVSLMKKKKKKKGGGKFISLPTYFFYVHREQCSMDSVCFWLCASCWWCSSSEDLLCWPWLFQGFQNSPEVQVTFWCNVSSVPAFNKDLVHRPRVNFVCSELKTQEPVLELYLAHVCAHGVNGVEAYCSVN